MSDMKQPDLFEAKTTWFHVFRAMVEHGDVADMGPIPTTVYLVIKAYTSFQDGRAFPSIDTIVNKSGVSRRSVINALQILEEKGYLTKELVATKKGAHNVYRVREQLEIVDSTGTPVAKASWDYVPMGIKTAMAELGKVLIKGDTEGLQVVNIEKLTVNVTLQNHFGSGANINQNHAPITHTAPVDNSKG